MQRIRRSVLISNNDKVMKLISVTIAPYVPIPDRDLVTNRMSVLSDTQGSNFLDLKMSPIFDSDDAPFEGFCYFRDPDSKVDKKKGSSQRPLSSIMRRRTSRHSTRTTEEINEGPASPRSGEVRSILRSPSRHFPWRFFVGRRFSLFTSLVIPCKSGGLGTKASKETVYSGRRDTSSLGSYESKINVFSAGNCEL